MTLPENAAVETVILQVPKQLYTRARQAAGEDQKAVEQMLVGALASGMSLLEDLPDEMVMDMATLALLNDSALWRVARATMSDEHYQKMDRLLAAKKQGPLKAAQQRELDTYLAEYEKIVLQRAHAAVLLKQRDYDLSDPRILNQNTPNRTNSG